MPEDKYGNYITPMDHAMGRDNGPRHDQTDPFAGIRNDKPIQADADLAIVRAACEHHAYKWPHDLPSGVMFYKCQRVTIEAFQEQVKLFRPDRT